MFEIREDRALHLARLRPSWGVYQNDSASAIRDGALDDATVTVLDVDPYGSPWPVIAAFMESTPAKRAPRLDIVVNDGLRLTVKRAGGWNVEGLHAMVDKYGNSNLYRHYLGSLP